MCIIMQVLHVYTFLSGRRDITVESAERTGRKKALNKVCVVAIVESQFAFLVFQHSLD